MRYAVLVIVALCSVSAAARQAQDLAPRFAFVSLKRNTSGSGASSSGRVADRYVITNSGLGALILFAYGPFASVPGPIINLPSWVDERYDAVINGVFSVPPERRQPLWRELLADRLKLAAHTETRPEPGFDLVLARPDRRLGEGLHPARQECPTASSAQPQSSAQTTTSVAPPRTFASRFPTTEEAMTRCGLFTIGSTLYSGGLTMSMLAASLQSPAGRRVIDRTGLEGSYSVTIPNFTPPLTPAFMSRLENEFGLTLKPSTVDVEVVVIDYIERPTEN